MSSYCVVLDNSMARKKDNVVFQIKKLQLTEIMNVFRKLVLLHQKATRPSVLIFCEQLDVSAVVLQFRGHKHASLYEYLHQIYRMLVGYMFDVLFYSCSFMLCKNHKNVFVKGKV